MTLPIENACFPELGWLAEVRDVAEPLSESRPIWVCHQTYQVQPEKWQPQRHPHCEVNLLLRGSMNHYSQRQQAPRKSGDLFLAAPGVPHYSDSSRYPMEWITVYFLPSQLVEFDRNDEGNEIRRWFAGVDSAGGRYVRPAASLRRQIVLSFGQLLGEFERPAFGSRLKLRGLLLALLVDIVRGAQAGASGSVDRSPTSNWLLAEKALAHLHLNFAQRIYTRDLVAATGLSETALREVFRQCVGMPWVQYLQNYRIRRAAALLLEPGASVTKTALAVGFENLGHFTTAFHACMNMSPRDFAKQRSKSSAAKGE